MDAARPVIDWLLEGDASIRWQVHRDLLDEPELAVRELVATEGWGAAILAEQAEDGSWGGGLYNPKWTSTFYSLFLLPALGLPPGNQQAAKAAGLLFERGIRGDGGLNFNSSKPLTVKRPSKRSGVAELCITGMGLSMFANYLEDTEQAYSLAECLLATQLSDGGWNCQRYSVHGSFNTTISVLEGLREWSAVAGTSSELEAAVARGQEFFFAHRLYCSHRTGEVARAAFTRFVFPYHWHFDALRGLDFLQSVGAPRYSRLSGAIELVRSRAMDDGRWKMSPLYRGAEHVSMERQGQASRWNTLRALRVLRWWDGA